MKLLFFDDYRLGIQKGDQVFDVSSVLDHFGIIPPEYQMEKVIGEFDQYRPRIEELVAQGTGVSRSSVRVRPPLPRPHNTFCAFSNYLDRPGATPGVIDFFYKGATCIRGDQDTIEIPDIQGAAAYQPEAEIAVIIGKEARHVSESAALDHVFGYMNLIDVSARAVPDRRTTFMTKGLEGWGPIGPVIVTKDEVPDPQNVQVRLWLNGSLEQDYNTDAMAHPVAELISWLSSYVTLVPGDIIACGTHHQGLCNINDGDKVELECDGLERLTIQVKSHAPLITERWQPRGLRASS